MYMTLFVPSPQALWSAKYGDGNANIYAGFVLVIVNSPLRFVNMLSHLPQKLFQIINTIPIRLPLYPN